MRVFLSRLIGMDYRYTHYVCPETPSEGASLKTYMNLLRVHSLSPAEPPREGGFVKAYMCGLYVYFRRTPPCNSNMIGTLEDPNIILSLIVTITGCGVHFRYTHYVFLGL